jgi:hypothetical protein
MVEKTVGQCNWTGCGRTSGAKIANRRLCLEHFLEFSDRRVGTIEQALAGDSGERNLPPEVLGFLSQVISQTMVFATETKLLAPLYRDNLIALSTRAAEIYKRVQRMPRIARRIACSVRTGVSAKEGAERCFTVNVSLRGASLEAEQALKLGQTIVLERADVPKKSARARVAWIRQSEAERFVVGVEILDEEDFWGLGKQEKRTASDVLGAPL